MKKWLIILILLVIIGVAVVFLLLPGDKEPVACTEDSRVCPDGSSVSRDPNNNCEFDPCLGEGEDTIYPNVNVYNDCTADEDCALSNAGPCRSLNSVNKNNLEEWESMMEDIILPSGFPCSISLDASMATATCFNSKCGYNQDSDDDFIEIDSYEVSTSCEEDVDCLLINTDYIYTDCLPSCVALDYSLDSWVAANRDSFNSIINILRPDPQNCLTDVVCENEPTNINFVGECVSGGCVKVSA